MNRPNSDEGVPRPEEFPLGSAESRAAARALLESREIGVRRITVIIDPAHRPRWEGGEEEGNRAWVGPWNQAKDGTLWRTAMIPKDMDEQEKRRLLAKP